MRWRASSASALSAAALATVVTVAGCSQTVGGTALRSQSSAPDPTRNYGYVDDSCGLLTDESVQSTLAAETVVRPYSGAVCQYVLSRGQVTLDVTYSWFETGSLDRERALSVERGAEITETVIERHPAFLAERAITGAACSATAAAGPGVLSWWVQLRAQSGGDPCTDAEELLSATLRSDM